MTDLTEEILDLPQVDTSKLELASSSKRFGNFVVDIIITYTLNIALIVALLDNDTDIESIGVTLMQWALMFLYFFITEWKLNGKTIGKFLTGTRALMANGEPLTAAGAAARSICRFIPFDALSFLGTKGWHDSISKTMVIDEKLSRAKAEM